MTIDQLEAETLPQLPAVLSGPLHSLPALAPDSVP